MNNLREYLKTLCSVPSPSGYESRVNSTIKDILKSFNGLSISEDYIGNIIAKKEGNYDKTTMLIAHCDEIGFSVKYIDDSGFIRITPIGGIDSSILYGLRVIIDHQGELINGVIGKSPVHLSRKEKSNHVLEISELWIDIGAQDKADAESLVSVGDPITFYPNYSKLSGDLVSSKSIDNRAGVATLLSVAESLQQDKTNNSIIFVFSAQEELGLRGAITAGYRINPDVCIAVDATHATDYPGINKSAHGDIRLGCGPSIPVGANFCSAIQNKMKEIAKREILDFQIESIPGYSGTDVAKVQLVRGGIQTGLISIPTRYMHTPVEVASYNDINIAVDILVHFCREYF